MKPYLCDTSTCSVKYLVDDDHWDPDKAEGEQDEPHDVTTDGELVVTGGGWAPRDPGEHQHKLSCKRRRRKMRRRKVFTIQTA